MSKQQKRNIIRGKAVRKYIAKRIAEEGIRPVGLKKQVRAVAKDSLKK